MSGRKGGRGSGGRKANIHMSKPELPPFLQRMKEQIVANEDSERQEQSQRKRKEREARLGRGHDEDDSDPTIVKLAESDLTEEEYKRMKRDLETQYKLEKEGASSKEALELDVDELIRSRGSKTKEDTVSEPSVRPSSSGAKKQTNKKLMYEDDEDESSSSSCS